MDEPNNNGGAGDGTNQPTSYTPEQVNELVAGLKGKNSELLGKLKQLQTRVLPEGVAPDEVQAALEFKRKAEEDRKRAEGDFEALKKQMADQHAKEVEKVASRAKKVEGKLFDVLARERAVAAIVKNEGVPDLLLPHVLGNLRVVEQDDDFTVVVTDAKGNTLIADAAGTPMSIEQFVGKLKEQEVFQPAFKAPAQTGSGARGSNGAPNARGGVIRISNAEARDPAVYRRVRAEAEKTGARIEFVD